MVFLFFECSVEKDPSLGYAVDVETMFSLEALCIRRIFDQIQMQIMHSDGRIQQGHPFRMCWIPGPWEVLQDILLENECRERDGKRALIPKPLLERMFPKYVDDIRGIQPVQQQQQQQQCVEKEWWD